LACLHARHAVEFFFGREVDAAEGAAAARGPGASVGSFLGWSLMFCLSFQQLIVEMPTYFRRSSGEAAERHTICLLCFSNQKARLERRFKPLSTCCWHLKENRFLRPLSLIGNWALTVSRAR